VVALDATGDVGKLPVDQRTSVGAVRADKRYHERFPAQRRQREGAASLIDEARLRR
jgi:hypothetical protein